MMQRTDRHFRALLRFITRRTPLYTEMVSTGAILYGDRDQHLGFSAFERPLALQLGGDNADDLAECARIAAAYGYDEINLNVGCPSERVQKGNFGVALMAQPAKVAAGVAAMRRAVDLPITVKHRIGFDDQDDYDAMRRFVEIVADAGCDRFTVHARKAWLSGLSPKQNRNVPPLRYEDVYRLKRDLPHLLIEINGGFSDLPTAQAQLDRVDGVMIGRLAYDDPYVLHDADSRFFGDDEPPLTRHEVVNAMCGYIERHHARGGRLHNVTRHMHMLFARQPGGKAWRRHLSEQGVRPDAGVQVVMDALERLRETQAHMDERDMDRDVERDAGHVLA